MGTPPSLRKSRAPSGLRRCRARVNELLAGCLANCEDPGEPPEPPTCAERCDAAAERIHATCLEQGGPEDECAAAVEDFLVRCAERCDRPEPPDPCDFDCASAAEKAYQRCVEAGGSEERCAIRAREMQQHCEDRLAEHCDKETMVAALGAFEFRRGDANGDDDVNIGDAIGTLNRLFRGQDTAPCDDAADSNDDGRVDISDCVRTLLWLFQGGHPLPEPLGRKGFDPTPDDLLCGE